MPEAVSKLSKKDREFKAPRSEKEKPLELEIESAAEERKHKGEDASFQNGILAVVCDGVGSMPGGAEAARLAVEAIKKHLKEENKKTAPEIMTPGMAEARMEAALDAANEAILEMQKKDKKLARMGTTASATLIFRDQESGALKMVIGQVGDSRVYRMRGNKLEHISEEDSMVKYFRKKGVEIDDQDDSELETRLEDYIKKKKIKPNEEAERLFYGRDPSGKYLKDYTIGDLTNFVTQNLGEKDTKYHIQTLALQAGDMIMLCSDGLSDNRNNNNLEKVLIKKQDRPAAEISQNMVDYGFAGQVDENNPRRNKLDDISVVVIKIENMADLTEEAEIEEEGESAVA